MLKGDFFPPKLFLTLFSNIDIILESDPDPNVAKILDPDQNSMYRIWIHNTAQKPVMFTWECRWEGQYRGVAKPDLAKPQVSMVEEEHPQKPACADGRDNIMSSLILA